MEAVIVFGTGRYYQSKKEYLCKGYKIVGFLDNAVKPGEVGDFDGAKIYHPENLELLPEVPIIIMSVKFYEMALQLVSLHVQESRILFGTELLPYYDETESIFSDLKMRLTVQNQRIVLQNDQNKYTCADEKSYKKILRELYKNRNPYIKLIAGMPLRPVSKRFGYEIGTPIDRYYIEKFLAEHQKYIHGSVMEIAEDRYATRFGMAISESYILHVNGWGKNVIKGNLATGEGIQENMVDCLICTQTIQCIYDISAVAENIYKMLKPGGTALITAHGISQLSMYDYQNWGEYWRFTKLSAQQLFENYFEKDKVSVYSYGNMKTAIAFMYGICLEEMDVSDLEYEDEQYPLVLGIFVRKL